MTDVDQKKISYFKATDPRISLLVSNAAIEFDKAARGVKTEFDSAKHLSDLLKGSFGIGKSNGVSAKVH